MVAIVHFYNNEWRWRCFKTLSNPFQTKEQAAENAKQLGYQVKYVKDEKFKTRRSGGSMFNQSTWSNQNSRLSF